jgi:hypothetical protein
MNGFIYGCSYSNFEIFFIIFLLFYRYKCYLSKIPRQVSSDNGRTGPWINIVDYVHCDTALEKFCLCIEDTGSCNHGLRPDLIRRSAEEDYLSCHVKKERGRLYDRLSNHIEQRLLRG